MTSLSSHITSCNVSIATDEWVPQVLRYCGFQMTCANHLCCLGYFLKHHPQEVVVANTCGHTLCNIQTTRISYIGSLFLATLCTAVYHCMDSCVSLCGQLCFTLSVHLCFTLCTAVFHCMDGCVSLLVYSCVSLYVQLCFTVWMAVFHS